METKKKDKIGYRYGMLIALERFKKEVSHGKNIWYKCLCDCGKTCEVHSDNLRSKGGTKSCGCNHYYGSRTKDWVGHKFWRLTPIKPTTKRAGKSIIWLCKCDCGVQKEISASDFVSGKTKSCGCLLREQKPKSYNPDRFRSLAEDIYMDNIIRRTKKSNLELPEITLEDWIILCQKPCSYCGEEPSNSRKDPISDYIFKYNGLDRIDPSLSYKKSNVVPCCRICNTIKFDLTFNEFVKKLIKINQKLPHSFVREFDGVMIQEEISKFGTSHQTLYNEKVLKRSRRLDLPTGNLLSLEEYANLIKQNCFYCGDEPSKIKKFYGERLNYHGIDRLDSSIGYSYENCVPCCTGCNSSKMRLSYEEFIKHIQRISEFLKL